MKKAVLIMLQSPWEKRQQLSLLVHQKVLQENRTFLLSCDTWTEFFSRLDVPKDMISQAITNHILEYIQVSSLINSPHCNGADLSRVLGEVGLTSQRRSIRSVIVDDVDAMIDLGSHESTLATFFALIYALQSKFQEITLFTNTLNNELEKEFLEQVGDTVEIISTLKDDKSRTLAVA